MIIAKRDWLLYSALGIIGIIPTSGLLNLIFDSQLLSNIFGLSVLYGPFVGAALTLAYLIFMTYDGVVENNSSGIKLVIAIFLTIIYGFYLWVLPKIV